MAAAWPWHAHACGHAARGRGRTTHGARRMACRAALPPWSAHLGGPSRGGRGSGWAWRRPAWRRRRRRARHRAAACARRRSRLGAGAGTEAWAWAWARWGGGGALVGRTLALARAQGGAPGTHSAGAGQAPPTGAPRAGRHRRKPPRAPTVLGAAAPGVGGHGLGRGPRGRGPREQRAAHGARGRPGACKRGSGRLKRGVRRAAGAGEGAGPRGGGWAGEGRVQESGNNGLHGRRARARGVGNDAGSHEAGLLRPGCAVFARRAQTARLPSRIRSRSRAPAAERAF
jgi:hypothetical protein